MKAVLAAALGAAALSSAATWAATRAAAPAPPRPPDPGNPPPDLRPALEALGREIAALRAELAARPVAGGDGPVTAEPERSAAAASPSPGAPYVRPRGEGVEAPASGMTSIQKFREVAPRLPEGGKDDDGRRAQLRKWMFRGEREVLEWFGQPLQIDPSGELEMWHYEVPTGEIDDDGLPRTKQYWIRLNKGRLVDMGD
jgi:hypothetical protein